MGRHKKIVNEILELGNFRVTENNNEFTVSGKPGPTSQRVKSDPLYAFTRGNNKAFKECAVAASLLRTALHPLLVDLPSANITARTQQLMLHIKALDKTPIGYQSIQNVFDSPATKQILHGFNFNKHALLSNTLLKKYSLRNNSFRIPGFISAKHLAAPLTATHVVFHLTTVGMSLNPESAGIEQSPAIKMPLNERKKIIEILLPAIQGEYSQKFTLVKIVFLNKTLPVNSKKNNVLAVL